MEIVKASELSIYIQPYRFNIEVFKALRMSPKYEWKNIIIHGHICILKIQETCVGFFFFLGGGGEGMVVYMSRRKAKHVGESNV